MSDLELVLNYLTEQLIENKDIFMVIKDDASSLLNELKYLQAFLRDANRRQNNSSSSEMMKLFVKKLRQTVNEAEILIDKFVIEAMLHKKKEIVKRTFDVSHFVRAKHCCREIKDIMDRLKEIRNSACVFSMSLQFEVPTQTSRHELTSPAPLVEEDEVVGFDEEADKIINRLLGGSTDLEFIPIVGMPGLGKTTLANKIFKHSIVEHEFSIHIWVYVSKSYTRRDVFFNIISQFTRNTEQYLYEHENVLAEVVCKYFLEEKYLIVLDDIWTREALNGIKIALPNNRRASRVLLTTRDTALANICCNNCPHHLKFLTDNECWELLKKNVFHRGECLPDLEEVGKSIARKCMGLPIATLVIAGALIGRRTRSEWERVHRGVCEYIIRSDNLMTMKLVQMSYDSLPVNLKVCFLYCSVFPRGFEIPAWKIIRLWIAEGFIEDPKTYTLENLAEEYLNVLVSKNLLIITRRTSNGQIKTFRMHDMLHEFCTLEANEENLFKEIKLGVEQSFPRNQELATFRRLCIGSSVEEFISTKPYCVGIRSFLCFSSQKIMMPPNELGTIPKSFPLLRVFDIESIIIDRFKKQFFQLYHLRYIALSSDSLQILPNIIGDLWNLQTLIIWTQQKTLDIQADICNMPRLRHLHTNASAKLCSYAAIKTNKHGVLQTLSTIEPESCTEHVFARCQNLKKLGIRGKIDELVGPFLNVNKLKCLEKLKLMNDHLSGGKLRLPSESIFPMSLKQVTLSGTRLNWNEMGRLAHLEVLEVLKLKEDAFTGDYWESKDYFFTCLKVLWIEKSDLVSWKASNQNFPSLKRLVLRHLDKLEEVPIELAYISSLQMMELENISRTAVESSWKIESRSECSGFKLSISPPISDGN